MSKLKSLFINVPTPLITPSPDYIPFEEQLVWAMWTHRESIFDTVDVIYYHFEYMSLYTQYLLNKQYFVEYAGSTRLTVHIVDDRFTYEPNHTVHPDMSYNPKWCYPQVIDYGKILIDGPWIDKLHHLFITKNVKQLILDERADRQRKKELEEQRKQRHKECCKTKRDNILKEFK
jgi:hypothetical protein